MDFSMMNGLASVEATMYQQNIEDLILLVDKAPSSIVIKLGAILDRLYLHSNLLLLNL